MTVVYHWAGLIFALYGLNFALSFHNVWPTLWIMSRHEISIEITTLVFVIWLWSRRSNIPRIFLNLAAGVLTAMTIGRYAEVTAPALYGRPVNIYWDAQFLPHVAEMLIQSAHPVLLPLGIIVILFILYSLFILLRAALERIVSACRTVQERRVVGITSSFLLALYLAGYAGAPVSKLHLFSLPVSGMFIQQAGFVAAVANADEILDILTREKPLGDFPLPKLGKTDVILHFIESYGAVAFDAPEIAAAITPSRNHLAEEISRSGRRVVSAMVVSPTFGGGSWLAHSSVMTGLNINDQSTYNLLLTRKVPTLSTRFTALGYRSVALMPGLRNEWPEGRFYNFAYIYGAPELRYEGPAFGWWTIPDQYSMMRLKELELDRSERSPLFVMFTAISSHMPFRPTPPYQPDWSRMLTDQPYDEAVVREALSSLPEWTNLRPAYAGTLTYTFEYLAGFVREQANRDFLWILIGDHQPAASVSGEGVRWDSPVHIISTNNQLIEALLQHGFVEGLVPDSKPIGPMHSLSPMLLGILRD